MNIGDFDKAELEQFYIANVRMYARIIMKNPFGNCTAAVERMADNQHRLVSEFGWDWEQAEQLEIDAYKAA